MKFYKILQNFTKVNKILWYEMTLNEIFIHFHGTLYSKTSFLVQIKFITKDLQQTQTQTLIIN